jgi:hypothetical protein
MDEIRSERAVVHNNNAVEQDNPVQQRSKSVQTAIGLYRKMTPDQRNEVKAARFRSGR